MKRVFLAFSLFALLAGQASAQGIKISNLPNGTTPLSGAELVPVVQGSTTVKVTAQAIANLAPDGGPIANNTLLGNVSGGSASPTALNATQVTALLNPFSSSLKGLVPASGGGTTNFLRADGSWAVPPGGTGCTLSVTANNGLTAGTNPFTCTTTTTLGLAPIANNNVLGNISGSTAAPTNLTQAQLTALVNIFTSTLSGAVPSSGGGSTNFLRADGTWALPAGSCSLSLTAGIGVGFGTSPIGCNTTTTISVTALPNLQTSVGSYTYQNSDGAKVVVRSNASAMTDTLPQATASGNFASGWATCVVNLGSALLTITPTVSTVNGATAIWLGVNQFTCLSSDGTNYEATTGAPISATDAITAHAGGGQASATQLTSSINHVTVSGGGGADSVKLPVAFAGEGPVSITNDTANTIQVFGAGTDTINNVATATGVTQGAGVTTLYTSPVAGKWYSTILVAAAAGGTVTSVAQTVPSWLSIAGSPVTSAGTLAITAATGQTANSVLATPNGSTGALGVRSLVSGDLPNDVAYLDVIQSFTKSQRFTPVSVSPSGAIFTPNFDNSQNFSLTLVHASCPCTLANPSTTPVAGQIGYITVTQSSTGSDLINTYGSSFVFATGQAPTLSTAPNASDTMLYVVRDATHVVLFPPSGAQLNAAQTWTATQTFGTIGGYLANVGTQTGTSCTIGTTSGGCTGFSTGDCGTFIRFTNAGAVTVTVPNSLPVGCQVAFEQDGAGKVSLSAASGATIHSAHSFTGTVGQFGVIGISVYLNSGGSAATAVLTGDGA